MRIYGLFLAGIGVFFAIIGLVYWFTSYEDGGFLMLIGSALLGLFPGSYYLWWSAHMKPQADDDPGRGHRRGCRRHRVVPGVEHLALHPGHGRTVRRAHLRLRALARPDSRAALGPVRCHRAPRWRAGAAAPSLWPPRPSPTRSDRNLRPCVRVRSALDSGDVRR